MTKGIDRSDLSEAKRLARRVVRLAAEGMALGQPDEDSSAACRLILKSTVWQRASRVMLYVPMRGELNVNSLIENGLKDDKLIALPRFSVSKNAYEACGIDNLSDLVPGKFGVLEPPPDCQTMDTKQLDLAIVPGVAFAGLGGRLGRGGGFFDRLLTDIPAKKCGVCFEQQVYPDVPVERHDVKMDMIATPSGWLIPPPS
ncbi:MAG: 5-formyltetrahydrofolate cyclo-ligase [Verrucomicrobia bacterium]|nr:5-formyltetrahydrofolate cyclo-ligase [Verrucomicrobiota bacterium]MBT6659435.1 5-formyltetrahydrofolate cyclo-ligase [Verrucomicrobiota bacterium]MBT7735952.1 5-formyltetrahydrofolate cyclo-ligase [Verrucomicrobiota bacterium]